MIRFEKISDGKYRAIANAELNKKIDLIMSDISLGEVDSYLDVNNDSLKKTLLARLISIHFFKDVAVNFNKYGFATILVDGLGYKLQLSVGNVQVDEKSSKRLSGVFYTL